EGNGFTYDMNSMYLYYMSSAGFTIPTKQEEFEYITNEAFKNIKFYHYGIYRCKITDKHKLFKPSKDNYYTHFDLELCKVLKINVDIIEDGQANCMLYKSGRINGNKMFGPYVEYMFDLKKKGLPVKDISTLLWGKLTQI